MQSRRLDEDTVWERKDLNAQFTVPIFDPIEYRFSHKLTRDEMKIIKANPKGYIEFSDKDGNTYEGFIHSEGGIEHNPNEGIAEFVLLKVNRLPLGLSSEQAAGYPRVEPNFDKDFVKEVLGAEPESKLSALLTPYIKL
jgi:hypothetical protein